MHDLVFCLLTLPTQLLNLFVLEGDPLVIQYFLDRNSLLWILHEQLGYQVLTFLTDTFPDGMTEGYLLQNGFLTDFFVIVTIERQMSTQEHIENYAEGPAVNSLVIGLLLQDLGRHITQRSIRLHTRLSRTEGLCQTKVNKLDC